LLKAEKSKTSNQHPPFRKTIKGFKREAEKTGNRHQTMISDVLDTYSNQYLQESL